MLYLLDDTDEQVVNAVAGRLLSEGPEIIPQLEHYWVSNADPLRAGRIEHIIRDIQKETLTGDFKTWMQSRDRDLLQACLMVSRIHYPGLNETVIRHFLEKMRLDVWMAMYNAHSAHDKIRIFNHIFFERYGFRGNNENYHNPDNSLLNRVIETRSGNPISLCNLYQILAHLLGIPVFGVNLPQHFVLAYCDDTGLGTDLPFHSGQPLNREDFGPVLFYINPFSNGQIFLNRNIRDFLKAIKAEPMDSFFEPCNNLEILRRMLRNLHFSYSQAGDIERRSLVEHYMNIAGMTHELQDDDPED